MQTPEDTISTMETPQAAATEREKINNQHDSRDWEDMVRNMRGRLIFDITEQHAVTYMHRDAIAAVSALLDVISCPSSDNAFERRIQASSPVTKLLETSLHSAGAPDLSLRGVLASALLASSDTSILTRKSRLAASINVYTMLTLAQVLAMP